jgi:hypothetical protein
MSLRLEQTNPAAGEQIITTILLRNVTNTVLSYGVSSVAGEDGPIGFVVSTTNGPVARTRSEPPTIVSAKILELAPETQHKYEERIDKRFDLKHAGIYTVYARYGAGCPKCFEIRSAEITLEIHQ